MDEAEKMNEQAQNALLKTIEEPPEYGIIMLLTNNLEALLPTILSRCIVFHLKPVDNYKKIYQSDLCGWVGQIGYGQDQAWFANTYRAGKGEELAAAGFYATDKDTEYEIYVARNLPEAGSRGMERALNDRTAVVRGKLANAGYYTCLLYTSRCV